MEEKRTKDGTCDVNFSSLTHTRASCVCVCMCQYNVWCSPRVHAMPLDLQSRIDVSLLFVYDGRWHCRNHDFIGLLLSLL